MMACCIYWWCYTYILYISLFRGDLKLISSRLSYFLLLINCCFGSVKNRCFIKATKSFVLNQIFAIQLVVFNFKMF